ncbi:integrase domain protein [Streptococcus pneumoniae GA16242]|nr:integrase domain protein [Streptococcus pneumoniae GA16242]
MNYIDTNEMLFVETPRKVLHPTNSEENTKYLDQKEFKLFIQNLKDEALCDYRITKYIRIAKVLFLLA